MQNVRYDTSVVDLRSARPAPPPTFTVTPATTRPMGTVVDLRPPKAASSGGMILLPKAKIEIPPRIVRTRPTWNRPRSRSRRSRRVSRTATKGSGDPPAGPPRRREASASVSSAGVSS